LGHLHTGNNYASGFLPNQDGYQSTEVPADIELSTQPECVEEPTVCATTIGDRSSAPRVKFNVKREGAKPVGRPRGSTKGDRNGGRPSKPPLLERQNAIEGLFASAQRLKRADKQRKAMDIDALKRKHDSGADSSTKRVAADATACEAAKEQEAKDWYERYITSIPGVSEHDYIARLAKYRSGKPKRTDGWSEQKRSDMCNIGYKPSYNGEHECELYYGEPCECVQPDIHPLRWIDYYEEVARRRWVRKQGDHSSGYDTDSDSDTAL
jgi:hypothetical protein